jgi:hypothetical protein
MRAVLSDFHQHSQQQLSEKLPQLSVKRNQQIKQLLREASQAELG